MRTVHILLISIFINACLATPTGFSADDKEKKEKDLKFLAEFERVVENEDWAVQNRKVIAELTKELEKAGRMDVFRLIPRDLPANDVQTKKSFHGYEILSDGNVVTATNRKELAAFIGKTLHWNYYRQGHCFHPRHGLRAVSGKQILDLVICFECWQVAVYTDDQLLIRLALSPVDANPLEQLLLEVEKRARERGKP